MFELEMTPVRIPVPAFKLETADPNPLFVIGKKDSPKRMKPLEFKQPTSKKEPQSGSASTSSASSPSAQIPFTFEPPKELMFGSNIFEFSESTTPFGFGVASNSAFGEPDSLPTTTSEQR